jgi:hypothetical protein
MGSTSGVLNYSVHCWRSYEGLRVLITACLLPLVAARTYTQIRPAPPASPLVERVGDHGFVPLPAPSFGQLTLSNSRQSQAQWKSVESVVLIGVLPNMRQRFHDLA